MSTHYNRDHVFGYDDFEDGERVQIMTGHDFEKEEEITCEIVCCVVPYRQATRYDPAEGGYAEDLRVLFEVGGRTFDLAPELSSFALGCLEEEIFEYARERSCAAYDFEDRRD